MNLAVNLVRTVPSGKLFAAVDAILGTMVTSNTPKCNEPAKIRAN